MPILNNVSTKSAKQIWQSPDGQKTIFEVVLDYNGQEMSAKTYSGAIARDGWSGDIESYDKQGRNGSETFVKQAPKEDGGQYPSRNQGGGYKSTGGGSSKKDFDNFTMYLSYAKDLVVTLQETSGYDQEKFEELLQATIKGGKVLYGHRPGAEPETPAEPKQAQVDEVINDSTPIDMADLDALGF